MAGNAAYGARQYSEALRCYQQGLESERTNMALHANAAMAALKINCFVQAIEHADKVGAGQEAADPGAGAGTHGGGTRGQHAGVGPGSEQGRRRRGLGGVLWC